MCRLKTTLSFTCVRTHEVLEKNMKISKKNSHGENKVFNHGMNERRVMLRDLFVESSRVGLTDFIIRFEQPQKRRYLVAYLFTPS